MRYLADEINEKYKDWGRNNTIFISTPTGSGKTTFILSRLLAFAKDNKRKILYLVNRKILKEQLKQELDDLNDINRGICDYIDVKTYQEIEEDLAHIFYEKRIEGKAHTLTLARLGGFINDLSYEWNVRYSREFAQAFNEIYFETYKAYTKKYFYIVADECHYFVCDAIFNPRNQISFDCICASTDACHIYMSATIDKVQEIVKNSVSCQIPIPKEMIVNRWPSYKGEPDYSYVNLHCFEEEDELIEIIKEGGSKWLVFVDDKRVGSEIKKGLEENDVISVFIDAEYEKREDSFQEVTEIIKKQMGKSRVIIATSTLDNGITIKDSNLVNMVIIADNKEEFLQMLGRKRLLKDTDRVNLYIKKRKKADFEYRKRYSIDRMKKFISGYCRYNKLAKEVLSECYRNEELFENYRKVSFIISDTVMMSELAINQVSNWNAHYLAIINRFDEEGENAFLYQQAEWLNISKEDVDKIVESYNVDTYDKCINKIVEVIEEAFDSENQIVLNEKTGIELKRKIQTECKYVLNFQGKVNHVEECGKQTIEKIIIDVGKPDRPLSEPQLNGFFQLIGLDYVATTTRKKPLSVDGKTVYIITRK